MAEPSPSRGRSEADRRQFIRHPAEIPLDVRRISSENPEAHGLHDVSYGGLSFDSEQPLVPGTELELHIGHLDPPFSARAHVVWCQPAKGRYRIGVCFHEEKDAFRSRMIEQVCAIESYRREVREREGRILSSAEAAREWIERYAHQFPAP